MEFFKRPNNEGKIIEKFYPDISLEQYQHALSFLRLYAEGEKHSYNITKDEAAKKIAELEAGEMPSNIIRAHAADYIDFLNGVEND